MVAQKSDSFPLTQLLLTTWVADDKLTTNTLTGIESEQNWTGKPDTSESGLPVEILEPVEATSCPTQSLKNVHKSCARSDCNIGYNDQYLLLALGSLKLFHKVNQLWHPVKTNSIVNTSAHTTDVTVTF